MEQIIRMLPRGTGSLADLRPGRWEIASKCMDSPATPATQRTVEVVAGQTAEVEF